MKTSANSCGTGFACMVTKLVLLQESSHHCGGTVPVGTPSLVMLSRIALFL